MLRGLEGRSTVSRTGDEGICGAFACSDRRLHSLFVLRFELIEPSRVKVPRANTDAVTIDRDTSAIMLDWKRLITYCWKETSFRYTWYITRVSERIIPSWAKTMILA